MLTVVIFSVKLELVVLELAERISFFKYEDDAHSRKSFSEVFEVIKVKASLANQDGKIRLALQAPRLSFLALLRWKSLVPPLLA